MTFFRSRWVECPGHVIEVAPTELPAGFVAAGVAAGIKPDGLDVGVLLSEREDTVSAARFAANALLGAPVIVSQAASTAALRAVIANSGNANVADGERGLETARVSQQALGSRIGIDPLRIGLAATGVIGRELPRDLLVDGIERATGELGPSAAGFSEAIVTTDREPKRACLDVLLSAGRVRLAAQAKGAGMIAPRFATMFCFVETDAALAPETLDLLLDVCVKRSFERISVDGQLSTSDTVYALANGASGVLIEPETPDELAFGEALDALLRQLALEIVADGEGASRVGRVIVRGESADVERVARAVADSPLVKSALHGGDPNYGRLLQAAGQALAASSPLPPPFHVDLEIEGLPVVSGGAVIPLEGDEWRHLEASVARDEVEYALTIPGEGGEIELFFSDLSHAYVTLNAEYTT